MTELPFELNKTTTKMQEFMNELNDILCFIGDETSMWNRSVFSRIEFILSTYKEYMVEEIPVSWFPRSFGSVPIMMLFGDCDQLSPVSGLPFFLNKEEIL